MVLFHLKSPFRSRDIQFFVIFSFLSTVSRCKGSYETGITLTSRMSLHKLANVILETTFCQIINIVQVIDH